MILIALNTAMVFSGPRPLPAPLAAFTLFDVVVGAIALLLVVLYVTGVIQQARSLRASEIGVVPQPVELLDANR